MMRGVLPGRPDLVPAQAVSREQKVLPAVELRVVPTAEWVTRARAVQAEGGEVTPPADDEQELVAVLRVQYVIPSELVDPQNYPVVSTDMLEMGRVSLADVKARVHEALVKSGDVATAAKVVPQRSGAA